MGVLDEWAGGLRRRLGLLRCRHLWLVHLLVLFVVFGGVACGWGGRQQGVDAQQEGNGENQSMGKEAQGFFASLPQQGEFLLASISNKGVAYAAVNPTGEESHAANAPTPKQELHQESQVQPAAPMVPGHTPSELDTLKREEERTPKPEPVVAEHAEHGPRLPEISPIPGVTFVETMINLMEHELNGRFWGWRPNDIFIGQFTDDINQYQLGVLEAMRFTTLRLKDSLTRMGDADAYDPDLEQALNLFMNRATSFWFPSAESSYSEAVDHLKNFLVKLKTGKRSFYYRKDTIISLLATYKDLLGNVNKTLIVSPVSFFKADDYFYYAKGVSHVFYEILRVSRVGFQNQLASTLYGLDVMDEIIHELYRVEEMSPWIVLDSDLDGFFANHRANINAPLSEATHMMGVLTQF